MRPRPLLWALLALALAGCRSTELYVYNLREVHQPDGTARRVGNVQGTLGYTAGQLLSIGRFGKPGFIEGEDRAIEDPLGVGLENLTALLDDPNDEHARSRGVQMITWLGPVCSYTLSRQRCAEAIGELGPHYGVRGPVPSPEPAAGVEEVQLALEEMVRASGGDLELAALGTSSLTVEEAAEAVRALPLDRDGGRRALEVCDILLRRVGYGTDALGPVRELSADLARRCLEQTLAAMVEDRADRVRGAAIASWIELSEGRDPAPYEAGLSENTIEPVLACLRGLARYGAPLPEATLADARASAETAWMERVVALLAQFIEGPLQVAACRAMERLSGMEPNLHPEHWIAWWEDLQAGAALPTGE